MNRPGLLAIGGVQRRAGEGRAVRSFAPAVNRSININGAFRGRAVADIKTRFANRAEYLASDFGADAWNIESVRSIGKMLPRAQSEAMRRPGDWAQLSGRDAKPGGAGSAGMAGPAFADALDDYFFRQSRLAPSGGVAFDPRLSPAWAGVKLPL